MIIKKLNKVGVNSRTILIDKNIIELLNLGNYVTFEVKDNKIIIGRYEENEIIKR